MTDMTNTTDMTNLIDMADTTNMFDITNMTDMNNMTDLETDTEEMYSMTPPRLIRQPHSESVDMTYAKFRIDTLDSFNRTGIDQYASFLQQMDEDGKVLRAPTPIYFTCGKHMLYPGVTALPFKLN